MSVSVKLTERTRRLLRLIAALTDRNIQEVAEELAEKEFVKLREEREGDEEIRPQTVSPD